MHTKKEKEKHQFYILAQSYKLFGTSSNLLQVILLLKKLALNSELLSNFARVYCEINSVLINTLALSYPPIFHYQINSGQTASSQTIICLTNFYTVVFSYKQQLYELMLLSGSESNSSRHYDRKQQMGWFKTDTVNGRFS